MANLLIQTGEIRRKTNTRTGPLPPCHLSSSEERDDSEAAPLNFSLIRVIVGEFIEAEQGLGRIIVEAQGRGDSMNMMLATLVLVVVDIVLAAGVRRQACAELSAAILGIMAARSSVRFEAAFPLSAKTERLGRG